MEPTQQDSLPFLDTLVTIQPDNTFSTTVYRKPTHTDQYLHWNSNHHIIAKQSVFNTLAHRAKTVSSSQVSFNKEMDHIKTALQHCQFPTLGPEPVATQVHPIQPAVQLQYQHYQQQQPSRPHQKQGHHCSPIHSQHK